MIEVLSVFSNKEVWVGPLVVPGDECYQHGVASELHKGVSEVFGCAVRGVEGVVKGLRTHPWIAPTISMSAWGKVPYSFLKRNGSVVTQSEFL